MQTLFHIIYLDVIMEASVSSLFAFALCVGSHPLSTVADISTYNVTVLFDELHGSRSVLTLALL